MRVSGSRSLKSRLAPNVFLKNEKRQTVGSYVDEVPREASVTCWERLSDSCGLSFNTVIKRTEGFVYKAARGS